jgi:hypothetical protein
MWNNFRLEEIESSANVIIWDSDKEHFILNDEDFKNCVLDLDVPPSELLNVILEKVGIQAEKASRVEVSFDKFAPPMDQLWNESSKEGFKVPVGLTEAGEHQYLGFDSELKPHGLVAGRPGSGKTNLFHVLITALGLIYSPRELEFYLVDLRTVGFKIYATTKMPHARVVASNSDREFGLSVLKKLNDEMDRRSEIFPAGIEKISDYRQKTGEILPRILLLVDEFHMFFSEEDDVAKESSRILNRLVTLGRGFGIHVLLGSQTLAGARNLSRTFDQMVVRVALQCSDNDSRLILAEDNSAARHLSRSGEAIYNDRNGFVNSNIRFQVVWLSDQKRDFYLQQICKKANDEKYIPPTPRFFEGNILPELKNNSILNKLIMTYPQTPLLKEARVWLGEPITIKDPTSACLRSQRGDNMVIVGNNDTSAAGILLSSLISLASQYNKSEVKFYITNLSSMGTKYSNLFSRLSDILPHSICTVESRNLPKVLNEIAIYVKRRLETDINNSENPIYLVIFGIHRARDLNGEDLYIPKYGDEETQVSSSKQFSNILKDGPSVGIHTLTWCDSYNNLRRINRQILQEFDMRVTLQISEEDSRELINSRIANQLGPYRALYFSEKEGKLEKFQPYELPTEEWLDWVEEQFHMKG